MVGTVLGGGKGDLVMWLVGWMKEKLGNVASMVSGGYKFFGGEGC